MNTETSITGVLEDIDLNFDKINKALKDATISEISSNFWEHELTENHIISELDSICEQIENILSWNTPRQKDIIENLTNKLALFITLAEGRWVETKNYKEKLLSTTEIIFTISFNSQKRKFDNWKNKDNNGSLEDLSDLEEFMNNLWNIWINTEKFEDQIRTIRDCIKEQRKATIKIEYTKQYRELKELVDDWIFDIELIISLYQLIYNLKELWDDTSEQESNIEKLLWEIKKFVKIKYIESEPNIIKLTNIASDASKKLEEWDDKIIWLILNRNIFWLKNNFSIKDDNLYILKVMFDIYINNFRINANYQELDEILQSIMKYEILVNIIQKMWINTYILPSKINYIFSDLYIKFIWIILKIINERCNSIEDHKNIVLNKWFTDLFWLIEKISNCSQQYSSISNWLKDRIQESKKRLINSILNYLRESLDTDNSDEIELLDYYEFYIKEWEKLWIDVSEFKEWYLDFNKIVFQKHISKLVWEISNAFAYLNKIISELYPFIDGWIKDNNDIIQLIEYSYKIIFSINKLSLMAKHKWIELENIDEIIVSLHKKIYILEKYINS